MERECHRCSVEVEAQESQASLDLFARKLPRPIESALTVDPVLYGTDMKATVNGSRIINQNATVRSSVDYPIFLGVFRSCSNLMNGTMSSLPRTQTSPAI